MDMTPSKTVRSIEWVGDVDGHVRLVDQTLLPETVRYIEARDVETVWDAIQRLCVRGAPAIGIAAAMGLVVAVQETPDNVIDMRRGGDEAADYLASSRPTAVNLFWALERMKRVLHDPAFADAQSLRAALLAEAQRIRAEDADMCRTIGELGEPLIPDSGGVLTHCNAGGLATSELGTALAPIFRVYADETRPLLQGARLTAWELQQAGVDVTVICDNMAAQVMRAGLIDIVITGADRIAANGDTANKIGTYGVAVLAAAHNIPFYVAAPASTFDLQTLNGDAIPIEERSDTEVRNGFGRQTVPDGVPCYCPAFDVTPARLIRGIITDRGIITPVTAEGIARTLAT
jgi:methylthioribose-1-phosphate isomerase